MRRSHHVHLKTYTILGVLFSIALGMLLHFTFEWSGHNRIVAFFSPINESTWEHLKMLVFPILIFSIPEYIRIGSQYENYIIAKAIGLLTGMFSIVMLYYTYSGIIGTNYLVIDITVFILGIILSYLMSYALLNHHTFHSSFFQPIGVILVLLIIIAFMWFTVFSPSIHLFLDPVSRSYGYNGT